MYNIVNLYFNLKKEERKKKKKKRKTSKKEKKRKKWGECRESFYCLREYIYGCEHNFDISMNMRGASNEISDGNEELVIGKAIK